MGYEIYIVRQSNWDLDEASNISLDEWLNYIKSDSELELDCFDKLNPDSTPGFCYWNNSPETEEEDDRPWLNYGHGHISAKNPEIATIIKMVNIANKLKAKVRGDEGEFYNELGEGIMMGQKRGKQNNTQKPWWKLW